MHTYRSVGSPRFIIASIFISILFAALFILLWVKVDVTAAQTTPTQPQCGTTTFAPANPIFVRSAADDPDGQTLRAAINRANAEGGGEIVFGSYYFDDVDTITLTSELPAIETDITIYGLHGRELWFPTDITVSGDNDVRSGFVIKNGGKLTVSHVNFALGRAASGGAFVVEPGGRLHIDHASVTNNNAAFGGAIYNSGGEVLVSNSTLFNNSASGDISSDGGAILTDAASTTTLCKSLLQENSATDTGGGVSNQGELSVVNSTMSGNSADYGAAIYTKVGTVNLNTSTLTDNTAGTLGDGIRHKSGTLTAHNSIIANNGVNGDCAQDVGTVTITYSLIKSAGCGVANGVSNNIVGVDPQLGSLADNGGPTHTHAINASSPAYSAGNPDTADSAEPATCPSADQRSYLRNNRCDMGAYEVSGGSCAATHNNGSTEYVSLDAQAVILAVQAAPSGGTVKVAGTCVGVKPEVGSQGTFSQTVYIDKSLTLVGGHTLFDWSFAPDSTAHPTVLDADRQGRVLLLEDAANSGNMVVTIAHITAQNGVSDYRWPSPTYDDGGGLLVEPGIAATVNNSTFRGNYADTNENGAGIAINASTLTVNNSVIFNNSPDNCGGGIYNRAGTLTVNNSSITHNVPHDDYGGSGGGICNVNNGTVTVNNSIISDNHGFGGGIYSSGTLQVSNSAITNNLLYAYGGGGAIVFDSGKGDIVNSTLSGNFTDGPGGGVYARNGAQVTIMSSSIVSNIVDLHSEDVEDVGGGIAIKDSATIKLANTIIAYNQDVNTLQYAPDCGVVDAGSATGQIISLGHNIISDTTGCPITATTGDQFNVDPLLEPLADNGGSTWTHALRSNSPASNNGDASTCPTTDQRGYGRSGTCDIGAYESTGVPTAVTLAAQSTTITTAPTVWLLASVLLLTLLTATAWVQRQKIVFRNSQRA